GDQTGCRSAQGESVTSVVRPEAISRAPTLNCVFLIFWKARREPSGDHRGLAWATASDTSEPTCFGLRPRRSTIQMRRGPANEASTATSAPSGDHCGLYALASQS